MNLLSLLFPKRCVGCGKLGRYFCSQCTSIIRIIEPNEAICPVCERRAVDGKTHPGCQTRYTIDGLTTFFHYTGPVRSAIKQLKYARVSDLANEFISLIPSSVFSNPYTLIPKPSFFVPIPLHPARFRDRGFNQAEVVGRVIAKRLNVPMKTDILRRVKKTVPQVTMKDRDERIKNMKDVFSIHNSSFNMQNSNVLLFDDVFTTGATMRAAANVLKRAGARWVWGITLAR